MNYLLDKNYFLHGICSIPGLGDTDATPQAEAELTYLINLHEPEWLRAIFGIELYRAYLSETDPAVVTGSRMDELIHGIEYEDLYGRMNIWDGLIRTETYTSPIANYVLRKSVELNISQNAIAGNVRGEFEAAQRSSQRNKIIPSWNEMVKWNNDMHLFLVSYRYEDGDLVFPEYRNLLREPFLNPIDYNLEYPFILNAPALNDSDAKLRKALFKMENMLGM